MKLGTVIKCDCFESLSVFSYGLNADCVYLLNRTAFNLLYNHEARFPLYKSYNTMTAIAANNGITLPIAYF